MYHKNTNNISTSRTTITYAQKHTYNYNMTMPGRHSDDPNNSMRARGGDETSKSPSTTPMTARW